MRCHIEVKKHIGWTREINVYPVPASFGTREEAEVILKKIYRAVEMMGGCDSCLCAIQEFRIVEGD